jgi:hypothetical protein
MRGRRRAGVRKDYLLIEYASALNLGGREIAMLDCELAW